jgi:ribosomal protein L18E
MEITISKTKIENRMKEKMNPILVDTIIKLKKTNPIVAKELARPKRRWSSINLKDIDMVEGDVLVVGKILSAGDLQKKKKIVAWGASEKALQKIKDSQSTFCLISDEIKKNPELKGYNILK